MEDQIRKIMEGAERLAYVVIQAVGDLDDYEQTRGPLLFLHGVGGLLCCLGKAANEGKIDADEWGGHLEGIGFMVGDVACRLEKLAEYWGDRVHEENKGFREFIEQAAAVGVNHESP